MKAIVIHEYGTPNVLKYEDYPDPVVAAGQVLVRVAATSINPVDLGRRSGRMKDFFPIQFPGVIGVDVSGTVEKLGAGVTDLSVGDKVFAYADHAYAELCVVPAATIARVPHGLDLTDAAALPLVTTTGYQLISEGTAIKSGQTVLVTGALGSVGRSAVYAAKQRGAIVFAGVRGHQVDQAKTLGADQVIATDDDIAIANLPLLDAVADTVGGKTAAALLSKVKPGGVFAAVTGAPNGKDFPAIRVTFVSSTPDRATQLEMAAAVVTGKLSIPIGLKLPLAKAAEAHTAMEEGGVGKMLLIP